MKKLFYSIFAIFIVAACSKDSIDTTSSTTDLSGLLVDSDQGVYKGIFTTDNADFRGTIQITLPLGNANSTTFVSPRAMLSLSNGSTVIANGNEDTNLDNGSRQVIFDNSDLSFTITVDEDGKSPVVSNVTYLQMASNMLVAAHTERAPVTPITGTYDCGACNGHPILGSGVVQTFNVMLVDDGMGGTLVETQTSLGGTTYVGVGFQDDGTCADVGTTTTCDLDSGISGGSTAGFMVNGNPVTWDGAHAYNNEPTSSGNDASNISGTWSWDSISFGTINGTFIGDGVANTLPITEDFEDGIVTYVPSVGEFTDGVGDFFIRTNGSNITPDYVVTGFGGASWFSAMDTNDSGGPNTVSLNWENIDVTGLTTITFSALFAEDDDAANQDWDANSSVRVEYSFDDGATWTDIIRFEADIPSGSNGEPALDTDGDGVGDGTALTDAFASFGNTFATGGNNMMDIRILIVNLNDGDEDLAIDDVNISGI